MTLTCTAVFAVNGSAYAYPTLGSTISVHAQSYKKKSAATQNATPARIFIYQQTQQTTCVKVLQQPVIEVSTTVTQSDFGTGPALQNIVGLLASDPSGDSYKSYDYRCFELLGHALTYLRTAAGFRSPTQPCREQQPEAPN